MSMASAGRSGPAAGLGASGDGGLATRAAAALPALAEALTTLAISAAMIALPILTHVIHPAAGILSAVVLAGLVGWRMPQVAVIAVLFALLFQNLFVSFAIHTVETKEEFDVVRGYNFVLLATVWLTTCAGYVLDWPRRPVALDRIVKVSVVLFAVVGVYFLAGLALYSINAIIYLRNIITPMLLFHVALITFARWPVRPTLTLTLIAVLLAFCGLFELADRTLWLDLTNGYAYWEQSIRPNWETLAYEKSFTQTGRVPTGLIDGFSIEFFNSPLLADLGIRMMRLFGPNMHAISYAYALSFFTIFTLYRGRLLLASVLFFLLFMASAKGPLIAFLLVGASFVVARLFGMRVAFACHALALAIYAAAGIVVGRAIGDFHVLGLMAGVQDFFVNPLGWGVGSGGNLSSEFVTIDWQASQAVGRTPFPVESAFAVLLYQIGVFALFLTGVYVWIAWQLLTIAERTGNALHAAAPLALMALVVSGLFQEEAWFSPLALGLFMALAGMIIGAAARQGVYLPRKSIS